MAALRIEPWSEHDAVLLVACLGDPAMMEHLGGPEPLERIAERQRRYEQPGSHQFKIVDVASGASAGWVGWWERAWDGAAVYEIGWAVLPAFQGRGVAAAAAGAAVARLREAAELRFLHAFPSVENEPSNRVCRRVGFQLLGPVDFEYPKGSLMRCNDWRLDLRPS